MATLKYPGLQVYDTDLKAWVSAQLVGLVHTTGEETITGAKIYAQGPFGASVVLDGDEIDLSEGVVFTAELEDDIEFTFTGVPSNTAATFNLILIYGGDYGVTWPSNVLWTDDTPPTLTEGGIDVLTFMTPDGGVTWYGTVALSGVSV